MWYVKEWIGSPPSALKTVMQVMGATIYRLEFYKILKISQLKYEVFHFLEYFGAGKHNPLNVSILLERKCIYHVSGILATHNSWLLEWRKKLFEGLIDTN